MKWISNLSGRYRHNIHLTLILALSLVLIIGGSPAASLVGGVVGGSLYYPFFKLKSTVMELTAVAEENRGLQSALVEASLEVTALQEAERENSRLRAVLGFEPPAGYTLLPAKVIAVHGEGVPIAAVINRGAAHGVRMDQPLINEQGLIGRIVEVEGSTAHVQLLTDPSHRVAVRVAQSREMGIVRFRLSSGLILDNFPIQGTVSVGDQVFSSGLGGLYPPGLVVGTVLEVERPAEEPFCRVLLQTAANMNSLEELFILQAVGQ